MIILSTIWCVYASTLRNFFSTVAAFSWIYKDTNSIIIKMLTHQWCMLDKMGASTLLKIWSVNTSTHTEKHTMFQNRFFLWERTVCGVTQTSGVRFIWCRIVHVSISMLLIKDQTHTHTRCWWMVEDRGWVCRFVCFKHGYNLLYMQQLHFLLQQWHGNIPHLMALMKLKQRSTPLRCSHPPNTHISTQYTAQIVPHLPQGAITTSPSLCPQ